MTDYSHYYKTLESGRFIAPRVYHCVHCGHLTTKPDQHKNEICPALDSHEAQMTRKYGQNWACGVEANNAGGQDNE